MNRERASTHCGLTKLDGRSHSVSWLAIIFYLFFGYGKKPSVETSTMWIEDGLVVKLIQIPYKKKTNFI